MNNRLSALYKIVIVIGAGIHLYVAFRFQSRAWIDEIWVVLDPAFRLARQQWHLPFGQVFPDPHEQGIRSWVAPFAMFAWLKLVGLTGLTKGSEILFSVRAMISACNVVASLCFASALRRNFGLSYPPFISALLMLMAPDLIHYSTTADLSVVGMPLLLLGLSCMPWHERALAARSFMSGKVMRKGVHFRAASICLVLASLIRFQYCIFPAIWLAWFLSKREWKRAGELAGIGLLGLALSIAFDSWMTGEPTAPIFSYFWENMTGLAASYGVTPFYFGFELLWRFMTEPAFLILLLTLPMAWRRAPVLVAAGILFFAFHCAIGHKEYRFFYSSALLLAGVAGGAFQAWVEQRPIQTKWILAGAFIIVFCGATSWRASRKVAWAEFESPSRLETLAGEQADVKGLVVYGWHGVHTGGLYTFHRDLPYVFSPTKERVKELARGRSPDQFNYAISRKSEPAPCKTVVRENGEAMLARCSAGEMMNIFR